MAYLGSPLWPFYMKQATGKASIEPVQMRASSHGGRTGKRPLSGRASQGTFDADLQPGSDGCVVSHPVDLDIGHGRRKRPGNAVVDGLVRLGLTVRIHGAALEADPELLGGDVGVSDGGPWLAVERVGRTCTGI